MIVSWLESITDSAREIYLLGDVIDYWFEYRSVVPRGYVRFLGQLGRMVDSGIKITWIKGNHDLWITDYLPDELGVEVVDGILDRVIDGKRFVMEHGDGMGPQSTGFKLIRRVFRNKFARWLFAGIHPRWTVGFAHGWSAKSRSGEGGLKLNEQLNKSVEILERSSIKYLEANPGVDYFLYGHLHLVEDRVLAGTKGTRMIVLGDWIDKFSYATYSPAEGMSMHQFCPGQNSC